MKRIGRRNLLYAFGIGSASLMFPRMAAASGKVVVAKAGENRFSFTNDAQAKATPCKVSSEDSGGACTVLELKALPRSGPFLHVHHRVVGLIVAWLVSVIWPLPDPLVAEQYPATK